MRAGVRRWIRAVVAEWHNQSRRRSIVPAWADTAANGALGLAAPGLAAPGEPAKDIVPHDAMLLVRRPRGFGVCREPFDL
mgnify:FL=1